MTKNIEYVNDGDTVTIKREDYERLVYERDEYRSMCHDFAEEYQNSTKSMNA